MEIGWYLRLSRTGHEEFLVDIANLAQVEHQRHVLPEWELDLGEDQGFLHAVFIRKS